LVKITVSAGTATPSTAVSGTDYLATGAVTTSGLTQATGKLLGRTTASTGAIEEITPTTGLSLSAGNLFTAGAYTANGFTMATSRLLGRTTASTGAAEEISAGAGLSLSGGSLATSGALTSSGFTMSTARLIGRTTASTGAVEEISIGSGLTLSGGSLNTASTAPNVCQTGEFDAGNSGTSITLNWNNGASQLVTLTGNLGTLTLSNPVAGCTYRIEFVEDGTGGRTITFPASIKFENDTTPTLITTADKVIFCSLVYTTIGADGYFGWCTTNPLSKP
jgi:hypothetical protein